MNNRKKVIIDCCRQCPHKYFADAISTEVRKFGVSAHGYWCGLLKQHIENADIIQPECPLEDA